MRDTVIIAVACLIAIGAGVWLYLSSPEDTAQDGVSVTVLFEGQNSGEITERKNYRIKNQDELDRLFGMMYGSGGPALPPVNFEEHEVLAVFDGTHSSGGYDIEIVSVKDEGTRTITLRHIAPGSSCMTTASITSPFVVATLPKSDLPITREEVTETRECK